MDCRQYVWSFMARKVVHDKTRSDDVDSHPPDLTCAQYAWMFMAPVSTKTDVSSSEKVGNRADAVVGATSDRQCAQEGP